MGEVSTPWVVVLWAQQQETGVTLIAGVAHTLPELPAEPPARHPTLPGPETLVIPVTLSHASHR